MSEASLRQALGAAIIAAIIGVVALALGAFVAPIPSATSPTSAGQIVTALLIRGILVILALGLAVFIAYGAGYRIESAAKQAPVEPQPQPDPSASSALVSLFTTPGTRRDAVFAGAIVMGAYWLITTLYIVALGKNIGNVGVVSSDVGSFISQHIALGIALIIAGLGCGGLGSRAALARKLTSKALSIPSIPSDLPPPAGSAATDPSAPQE